MTKGSAGSIALTLPQMLFYIMYLYLLLSMHLYLYPWTSLPLGEHANPRLQAAGPIGACHKLGFLQLGYTELVLIAATVAVACWVEVVVVV